MTVVTLFFLFASGAGCAGPSPDPAAPSLVPVDSGTDRDITAVWVDASGDLWLVSPPRDENEMVLLRSREGGEWTDRSRGFTAGHGISRLWGHSSGVMIGYNSTEVWMFSGDAWKRVLLVDEVDPIGVSGAEDGTVIAVSGYYPKRYFFNIHDPEKMREGAWSHALGDVWVFDKDHHVTIPTGRSSSPGRSAAEGEVRIPFPREVEKHGTRSLWSPDNREILAVGHKGLIVRLVGNEWKVEKSPVSMMLNSVWGDRKDRCVAVGEKGTVLLYDGTAWTRLPSGIEQDLTSVRGGADGRIFIAGEGGTLLELVWP